MDMGPQIVGLAVLVGAGSAILAYLEHQKLKTTETSLIDEIILEKERRGENIPDEPINE